MLWPTLAILGSGVLSSAGQYMTNMQNLEANARRFSEQTNLANTAHQREVLDLQAAGLNPVLSASSSGSAVPQLASADLANPGEGISRGLESAAKIASLDIPLKESQVAVNSAQATNLANEGELFKVQADAIRAGRGVLDDLSNNAEDYGEKVGTKLGEDYEKSRANVAPKATEKTHYFDPKRGRYVPYKKGK